MLNHNTQLPGGSRIVSVNVALLLVTDDTRKQFLSQMGKKNATKSAFCLTRNLPVTDFIQYLLRKIEIAQAQPGRTKNLTISS